MTTNTSGSSTEIEVTPMVATVTHYRSEYDRKYGFAEANGKEILFHWNTRRQLEIINGDIEFNPDRPCYTGRLPEAGDRLIAAVVNAEKGLRAIAWAPAFMLEDLKEELKEREAADQRRQAIATLKDPDKKAAVLKSIGSAMKNLSTKVHQTTAVKTLMEAAEREGDYESTSKPTQVVEASKPAVVRTAGLSLRNTIVGLDKVVEKLGAENTAEVISL